MGFVVEEEYGFDLVLRYRVRWRFSYYDGNLCQGGDCCFCDLNLVLGICPTKGPLCNFYEKKKLRKKIWYGPFHSSIFVI